MTARELLRRQIDVYEETWQGEHNSALECFDLQESVALGLFTFDSILRGDDALRMAAFQGKYRYTDQDHRDATQLIERWLLVSENLLTATGGLEAAGFAVDGATSLRDRVAEARWMLKSPSELFSHDKFLELRDQAVEEHQRGETVGRPG